MKKMFIACTLLLIGNGLRAQDESYRGGIGDGHALANQLTAFGYPAAFQPYIGNNGDGYAQTEKINQVFDFPYTFSAFLGGTGDGWTGVLKPNIVILPLTLLQFDGHSTTAGNELSWRTADERNTDHFDIERSTDGNRFTFLGAVPARGTFAGQSGYRFTDSTPPARAFYRLRMTDRDGSFRYSAILLLQSGSDPQPSLYPNPTTGTLYLHLPSITTAPLFCTVIDNAGRTITVQQLAPGTATYLLDVHTLAPGVYVLKIQGSKELRFIKQ